MRTIAKFLIKIYQILFASPIRTCRFTPSCSAYTLEAIEKYGFLKGLLLGLRRISSCQPFSKRPFYDPVG